MHVGKPLTSMVYEHVYDGILSGDITNNDILTENELAEKLAVSKAPVRGALILLCEEKVLRAIPRVGYQVLQITSGQVGKLAEARWALEPFLLEKAWPTLDAKKIRRLEDHLRASKKAELSKTSIAANWMRNIQFHMLLAGFAENEYLQGALERVLKSCARAATQYFLHIRGIPQGEMDKHDAIVAAIAGGDREAALNALREDIREII